MGMFDRVHAECPGCLHRVEFQSKAGECCQADFDINDCPPNILGDLHNESETCQKCGRVVTIKVETIARVE